MASSHNDDSGVKVVVRVRPWSEREKNASVVPVVSTRSDQKEVSVIKEVYGRATSKKLVYNFDEVFTNFSTQQEVFTTTLSPMIVDVLAGFEATVFAYGQTGTGKTYTMEGDTSSEEHQGVIPRAIRSIFESLQTRNYKESSVKVTYLEIYNEELGDLLLDQNGTALVSPSKKSSSKKTGSNNQRKSMAPISVAPKLMIQEDKKKNGRGVFCAGLNEIEVETVDDVLNILQQAQERRRVSETKMNKSSSRSHCLFSINVHTVEEQEDGAILDRSGRLNLCDLAGSECAKTAGSDSSGGMDRERRNINQSLLVLGRVITSLKEGGADAKNTRIPYRDSKLTRILQEALGGRSKTCIIATVSPSILAVEETTSTLNYAQQALGIKNKRQESSIKLVGGASYGSLSSSSNPSNTPASGASNMNSWNEMECKMLYMEGQVAEAQGMLGRKHEAMLEAQGKVDALEASVLSHQEAKELALASLLVEQEDKSSFLNSASSIVSALDESRLRLVSENTANLNSVEVLQRSIIHSNEKYCVDLSSGALTYQNDCDRLMNEIGSSFEVIQRAVDVDVENILKMRADEDEEVSLSVSNKTDAIVEKFTSVSGSLMQTETELLNWSESLKHSIEYFTEEHNASSQCLVDQTQKICENVKETTAAVIGSMTDETRSMEGIQQTMKNQVEQEVVLISDINTMKETSLESATEQQVVLKKIVQQTSLNSQDQINGRRKTEINRELDTMKKLVETKVSNEQKEMNEKCSLRVEELHNISSDILTSSQDQKEGRRNRQLEQGLTDIKRHVEISISEFQQMSKNANDIRSCDLQSIIETVSSTAQDQINGRRKTEIDRELDTMKKLVETKVSNEQRQR